jgi:hypothetical protein
MIATRNTHDFVLEPLETVAICALKAAGFGHDVGLHCVIL